ncbi:MAG TPA: phosphatidylglycerophosphatase A [Desulfobacteraceae bacterium]|nr:phosphatidylglycerophosphatase A [Deltaproteobacteria bacterium]RLB96261.1 MAG: phosphatidylglycerophosphatase A [Deltaproteobacteria bacterium]HDI59603.1 phosphatidylglycerophosphatase A [Desulfobacteraceae bacterium]
MTFVQKAVLFCGTGLMIGKIPVAPGTFGSVAGIALCLVLTRLPLTAATVAAGGFILFSVWIADRSVRILGAKDPGCIVIDEIAGMVATLYGLPADPVVVLAGFILFRLLDISKPFGIRRLERLPGGLGVVADDLAAGVVANLVLRAGLSILAAQ